MKINFNKILLPQNGNLVILFHENEQIDGTLKKINTKTANQLGKAIKIADFSGKKGQFLEIISPQKTNFSRIIIYGIGGIQKQEPINF